MVVVKYQVLDYCFSNCFVLMHNVNQIFVSVPDLQKTGEEVEQLKQEVDKLKLCGEILSAATYHVTHLQVYL